MYFQICSFSSLFKLWLPFLLNMQNNENNYEGAEREERKKVKKIVFNCKKSSSIYDVRKKSLKFGPPPSPSIHKHPILV